MKWTIVLSLCILGSVSSVPHKHHRVARVVGGKVIDDAARWPWLASLHATVPKFRLFGFTISSQKVTCGGSLLSSRWVLTAAHCLVRPTLNKWSRIPQFWTVRMGDINLNSDLSTDIVDLFAEAFNIQDAKDHDIDGEKIFIHPQYDPEKAWDNDLALIKLSREAPVASYRVPSVDSISINADPRFPQDGASCMFKGWGCQEFGGGLEEMARQVELGKVNDNTCLNRWNVNTQNKVCAGNDNTGICQGDSGGPLVCQRGGKWYQVGVASFTSTYKDYPGVFTRVSAYSGWINGIMDNN